MSLVSVLSVQVRPGANRRYEELVARLAKKAAAGREALHWDAHQTVMGEAPGYHFVTRGDDFGALTVHGTPGELVERVLGAKDGAEFLERSGELGVATRQTISLERPDLSYPSDARRAADRPFAMVTLVRARAGAQEAVEELLRKLAEAIPKVDDPARLLSFQTLIGDLRTMWTVRPMAALSDLDAWRMPQQLLQDAFGPAEGGLFWRAAMDALEEAHRSITVYRPDLSHSE